MSRVKNNRLGVVKGIHTRRYNLLKLLRDNHQLPVDLGGTDNSTHGADLRQLVKWGFVGRRQRVSGEPIVRSSFEYRILPKGLVLLGTLN